MPLLHWLTREKDIHIAAQTPYRLLEEVGKHSHGDREIPNMLIQGDNSDALKALLPYYAGKIKCIYIDPPYNTRSAFEHYDDNLEHAQWLAMMYPRLELLHALLSKDGSIWVSIDDKEGHYLKVIMDEIFGRLNFVSSFIWQKVDSPNDNKVPITPDHEFVLCYEKTKDAAGFKKKQDGSLLDAYGQRDEKGRLYRDRLLKKNGKSSLRSDRPTMFFSLEAPDGTPVFPVHDDGREARWSHSQEGVQSAKEEGRLIWKQRDKEGQNVWVPYIREFAPHTPARPHPTILLDVKTSRQAKAHQRELLPDAPIFDTVKPEQLIQRIFEISTDPGDFVLDSFLGSGTTAAVAHKMGRRYIGIEAGDHAMTHCVPRLQKVIAGEQGGISESVDWQGGGGFRFYRLGVPVFDETGHISQGIRFAPLAAHLWFLETGIPFSGRANSPFLGSHEGIGYYLLYNGILGDTRPTGGNILTGRILASLPRHDGKKIIFGEGCSLGINSLQAKHITFRQIPYEIKAR